MIVSLRIQEVNDEQADQGAKCRALDARLGELLLAQMLSSQIIKEMAHRGLIEHKERKIKI